MSNALGSVLPVEAIVERARKVGAKVLIDGCQAAPRMPVDVQAIGCDFYVFSGHKTYGPTGIGVLWGRLRSARGDAALAGRRRHDPVGRRSSTPTISESPHSFEAGTPDIAGTHRPGRGARLSSNRSAATRSATMRNALTDMATKRWRASPGSRLLGAGQRRLGVLSFNVDGVHPHDVGTILDQHRVAVRAGHHCAQPLMDRLGVAGHGARLVRRLQRREPTSTALVEAIEAVPKEMFGR